MNEKQKQEATASQSPVEKCECGASADDHVFSRSICPEPCGSMHYYCAQCGALSPFESCPLGG